MTASIQHLIKKSDAGDEFFPFDPGLVAAPGSQDLTNALVAESMCWFDLATNYIKPLTNGTTAHEAYFAGIVCDQVPAQYGSVEYPGGISPSGSRNVARVSRACQMLLKATAGELITPGKVIYPGNTDTQTMSISGVTGIGFVDPEQPVVVSATAGQLILCRVRANYPVAPLA